MPQRPGGRMSGGEQQMLTVARTLMGQPLLVLLDEPSEGVAPLIVQQMARTIRALKAQGVSVLLSEQNLPFAEAVADRAYLIEQGQVVHEGRMADVVANPTCARTAWGCERAARLAPTGVHVQRIKALGMCRKGALPARFAACSFMHCFGLWRLLGKRKQLLI